MGLSLLVVDDEANFLVLMDRILSLEGYRVTVAHGSEQALRLLDRQEAFDLAILDIKMHAISGIELLAEIKKRTPSTQVVMVTGYPTDSNRDECIKFGAASYLTKPFELTELKGVLRLLAEAPRI